MQRRDVSSYLERKEFMLAHHHLSGASAIIGIGGMFFNLHMIFIPEMETWRFREVNAPKI